MAQAKQNTKIALHVEPRFDVQPLEKGHGSLLRVDQACERFGVKTPLDFAKLLAFAGGIKVYTEGKTLLVEAASFSLAVGHARVAEGILNDRA